MTAVVVAVVCAAVVVLAGPCPRHGWATPSDPPPVRGPWTSLTAPMAGLWAAAALAVVGAATASPLLVGPGAVGAAVAGRLVEPVRRRRRAARRRADVTHLVDAVSRSVRSGATLAQALAESHRDGAAPLLDDDLRALSAQLGAGRPLPVVLDEWSRRSDDADLRLVAATVAVLAASGGSAGAALDATARTIRARAAAAAEVQALAAQARASAAVLVIAPAVFAIVLAAVDPRLGAFLAGSTGGAACVSVALVLDGFALWWMQRIIDGATR